jgi:DNA mismatch endonuclease (patch repair protein)
MTTPPASSDNARNTMRANRAVSAREVAFRRALWEAGARGYRLHPRLPGRPDIAFPALRVVIFVNGCFWHRCRVCNLPEPRANAAFWRAKLEANERRDAASVAALESQGWTVITVWEHEIRPDPVPRAGELAARMSALRATHAR